MPTGEKLQQNNKSKDKQKKLLIKKIMIWARQGFNSRNLGFHPFLLCASIKPSVENRLNTLQSYPNTELWKSMSKLSKTGLIKEIQEEINSKLELIHDQYEPSLIKEFQIRVQNHFDFTFLYKESEIGQGDLEVNVIKLKNSNEKQLLEKEESESKSLVKQIELCNSHQGTLAVLEMNHYHKLFEFLEKLKNLLNQSSQELKQFYNGLQLFLEQQERVNSKKVKLEQIEDIQDERLNTKDQQIQEQKEDKSIMNKQQQFQQNYISTQMQQTQQKQQQQQQMQIQPRQQTQQQEQQINNLIKSQQELLEEIKLESLNLMPGLALFLPNYDRMQPEVAEKIKAIEQDFFKELYFIKILNPENFNPKSILYLWRTQFESQYQKSNIIQQRLILDSIKKEL